MNGIAGVCGESDESSTSSMLDSLEHRGGKAGEILTGETFALGSVGPVKSWVNSAGNQGIILDATVPEGEEINLRGLAASSTPEEIRKRIRELENPFALASIADNRLILARDYFGIKPLYFTARGETIYFASEIKALRDITGGDAAIRELPAGSIFDSRRDSFHNFFRLEERTEQVDMEVGRICQRLRSLLAEAVRSRMHDNDRERLGLLLSGGLDSSIICALAVENSDRKMDTFSVGIEGSSDLRHARLVADYLGTSHHEYTYSQKEMMEILGEVIYHQETFDAPLIRSCIPNYLAGRMASEHGMKTLLSGEGSDELFAGYSYLEELEHDEIRDELFDLVKGLGSSGLQRVDRMNAAHGIECRLPFLDPDFVEFSLSIPACYKLYDDGSEKVEKWILRRAFEDYLPDEVVWRDKEKFGEGSGSIDLCQILNDQDFVESGGQKIELMDGSGDGSGRTEIEITEYDPEEAESEADTLIRSREEYYYYQIFRHYYPEDSVLESIGRWHKSYDN